MIGMDYQIQLEVNNINAFKSLFEDHWKDADFKFNFKF